MEIWKDIKGFENQYQISNLGNVKSLNYNHTGKPKNLAIKNHYSGYKMVTLSVNGKYKNMNVHRLVADAFLPNPNNLKCVNHIDGNKANNNVTNLEWLTHSQNTRHAINTGLRKDCYIRGILGDDHPSKKTVLQYDKNGNLIKEWSCISEAARNIGCNPCTIINCCSGRIKTCRGFLWKYQNV